MTWYKSVKERENYTCQECGRQGRDNKTHAHDPTGRHLDSKDGICLCASCHRRIHLGLVTRGFHTTNVNRLRSTGLSLYEIALIYGVTVFDVIRLLKEVVGKSGPIVPPELQTHTNNLTEG